MSNYQVFDTREKTTVFIGSCQECMNYVMELYEESGEPRYDIGKATDKHPLEKS